MIEKAKAPASTHSEAYEAGYIAAQKAWREYAGPAPFDPPNPYKIGTDEEVGFEAAVYDLTH